MSKLILIGFIGLLAFSYIIIKNEGRSVLLKPTITPTPIMSPKSFDSNKVNQYSKDESYCETDKDCTARDCGPCGWEYVNIYNANKPCKKSCTPDMACYPNCPKPAKETPVCQNNTCTAFGQPGYKNLK